MPHAPLFRSEEFVGVSERGRYGDAIEELDWRQFDIAQQHPEVIEEIRALVEAHLRTLEPVENQLER